MSKVTFDGMQKLQEQLDKGVGHGPFMVLPNDTKIIGPPQHRLVVTVCLDDSGMDEENKLTKEKCFAIREEIRTSLTAQLKQDGPVVLVHSDNMTVTVQSVLVDAVTDSEPDASVVVEGPR